MRGGERFKWDWKWNCITFVKMMNGMQRFFLTLSLFGTFSFCDAQKTITTANSDSSILITRDPRLDELVDRQKQVNLENKACPVIVYRFISVVTDPKASEVKLDFNSRFPDIPAYLTYQQPNFKVRVGDFRNRYEAQKITQTTGRKISTTLLFRMKLNFRLCGKKGLGTRAVDVSLSTRY